MTRTYLDHASTTPVVAAAVEAMVTQWGTTGNPSSLHASGRGARRVVEESREQLAALLGARPADVIFTSGGTEADNLAIKGSYGARRGDGRSRVVISAIEHHAVLDPARWLASSAGAELVEVGVDPTGRVDLEALSRAIDDRTAVVSVMWANNEIGTVQPMAELVEVAHRAGIWAHSDAVQAVGHLPVDFAASGLDLLTVNAHKLGGPVGVGALLARREIGLQPVQHGGGQERDVRSGTLDVAGVAGFAAALQLAVTNQVAERERLESLRAGLLAAVLAAAPDAVVHGPSDPAQRLPGVLNVELPGCSSDALLLLLDAAGIDCSTGSACTAGVAEPSHVLLALGRTERQAGSALRFSLGHTSTRADVDALAAALPEVLSRARAFGGVAG
ncbi:cysteine desulfurase family protein [Microlunatus aurantiacus]|uniref:Cysteine desulfurase family protein n=1 Tax=Microlunatus aurantiacus TaxID=446786 RepID=A0ABP7E7C3_9ACTN